MLATPNGPVESRPREGPAPRRRWILAVDTALFLSVVALVVVFSNLRLEDAYISFRYAHNLITGNGLVFNPGERVEGFSNPSWTLLLALLKAVGIPFRGGAMILATLSSAGLFFVLRDIVTRLLGTSFVSRVPLAGLAAGTAMLASFGNGLEGSLWAFLLLTFAWAVLVTAPRCLAAVAVAAFLTRPEGLALPFAASAFLVAWGMRGSVAPRNARRYVGACLGAVALLLALRFAYYGELLPNTLAAKSGFPDRETLRHGWWHLNSFAGTIGFLPILFAVGALARWKERWLRPCLIVVVGLLGLGTLVILGNGGDWMPFHRLVTPYQPLILVLVAVCLRSVEHTPVRRALAGIALVVGYVLAFDGPSWKKPLGNAAERFKAAWVVDPRDEASALAYFVGNRSTTTIRDVVRPEDLVALEACGHPAYVLLETHVLDVFGLTDRRIAAEPDPHAYAHRHFGRAHWGAVLDRRPAFIKLHRADHLKLVVIVPGATEELERYVFFRGNAPFQKHILLVARDHPGLEAFRADYSGFETVSEVLSTLPPSD